MKLEQKLILLLNQPAITSAYIKREKIQNHELMFRNIFPKSTQIQRFRHLQRARQFQAHEHILQTQMQQLIKLYHCIMKQAEHEEKKIEEQKTMLLKKHNYDNIQEDMDARLQAFIKCLERLENSKSKTKQQLIQIQKVLKMTQLRQALQAQNKLLKEQQRSLLRKQQILDQKLKFKKLRVKN